MNPNPPGPKMDAAADAASTKGLPAPYGRACTNCARAKCRCLYRAGVADCERCNRLGKQCVPSVSVRRRNGKRAHVSRAAQLEEKLEDLVTLLRKQAAPVANAVANAVPVTATATATPSTATATTAATNTTTAPVPEAEAASGPAPANGSPSTAGANTPPSSTRSASAQADDTLFMGAFVAPVTTCAPLPTRPAPPPRTSLFGTIFPPPMVDRTVPPPDLGLMPSCPYQPTGLEAEENLETFRDRMLIYMPFIKLPRTMTAETLRTLYPFLWFNIMLVTCKKINHQMVMSDSAKRFIAQKMVVDHEKSIDLLFGILTLLTWSQYYKKDKSYLSVMTCLAQSLVFDLGLDKGPSDISPYLCFKCDAPTPKEKTLEERRAVLACFLITSQVSYSMKRMDALNWTPFMDECLQVLSQQSEWDGDDLLLNLVKIQLIVTQLTRATSQSLGDPPPAMFLSALLSQLRGIKDKLPHRLQANDTLLMHFFYAESAIHEHARVPPKNPKPSATDLQRYEAFEASYQASNNWLEAHLTFPPHSYTNMTFAYWCHMGHCVISIYRLLFHVDDPAWDRAAARERIDLFGLLDRLMRGFDEITEIRRLDAGPGIDESMFAKSSKMIKVMKSGWLEERAVEGAAQEVPGGACRVVGDGGVEGVDYPMPTLGFEANDGWMAEFFEMNWEQRGGIWG
ncbi:hypothetical protein B0H67DRAFT_685933 [Lasiosphaeris hirsuta]|uniref:Zn(2)-C6 fungal-type domain-containing protein n=1 Tax=Lasiosphaeris hirsuta TaxID=260670 RepID=A0AA40DNU9_9PEZI|nr:hypothetical protein B0H67DRAFT_685933 [Lasiosphaeris hirsuta]